MKALIPMSRVTASVILILAMTLLAFAARERVLSLSERRADRFSVVNQPRTTNLSGAAAQEYLLETDDGKSLLAAVTAAQFGLEAREQSPFDAHSRAGYLGMSHDQNLNAWFSGGWRDGAADGFERRTRASVATRLPPQSAWLRERTRGCPSRSCGRPSKAIASNTTVPIINQKAAISTW